MNAVIRCDGDRNTGYGHLWRCANIAEELRRRGFNITFITTECTGAVQLFEASNGFPVEYISSFCNPGKRIESSEDAAIFTKILEIKRIVPDIVIIDSYVHGMAWEALVMKWAGQDNPARRRDQSFVLAALDDFEDRPHAADLVINPSSYSEKEVVRARFNEAQEIVCGPMYAPLKEIYGDLHRRCRLRESPNKLLISLGGSDTNMLTLRVLTYIMESSFEPEMIDVVISNDTRQSSLIKAIIGRSEKILLHEDRSCLADLTNSSNVSIGACGMSALERSCLRLPSLVISRSSEQHRIAEILHRKGVLHWAGREASLTKKSFDHELKEFLSRYSKLCSVAPLTDGNGCVRIVERMEEILRKGQRESESI